MIKALDMMIKTKYRLITLGSKGKAQLDPLQVKVFDAADHTTDTGFFLVSKIFSIRRHRIAPPAFLSNS
jgi:hypothetical protein